MIVCVFVCFVGWTYKDAADRGEKYKVGCFCLEKQLLKQGHQFSRVSPSTFIVTDFDNVDV